MNPRDNSGSLSKNQRKEKPSQPDMRGKAIIGGVQYWISAWLKEGDDGKWFSLSFTLDDQRAKPEQRAKLKQRERDDDIPF